MATKIKNKKMMLMMAEKNLHRITYTGAEIKAKAPTAETATLVGWDNLELLTKKPAFNQIKAAFVQFKQPVSQSSSLFNTVFKDNQATRRKYSNYPWLYSSWDWKNWSEGLTETDEIDVYIYQSQCFVSGNIEGTNTEEEIKTSCGTEKYAKQDDSWTISYSSFYETFTPLELQTSMTALMLTSKLNVTLEYKNKPKEVIEKEPHTFKFMLLFMSDDGQGYEGWTMFDGSLNSVSLGVSTESAFQPYTANISNETAPWIAMRDYKFFDLADEMGEKPSAKPPKGNG